TQIVFSPEGWEPQTFEHAIIRHGPRRQLSSTSPGLARRLGTRALPSLREEPLYPSLFFGSGSSIASGAGGPSRSDYTDELWGRGFMTESVDKRLPLSRFADISYELQSLDGELDPGNGNGSEEEVSKVERRRARILVPGRVLTPSDPRWN